MSTPNRNSILRSMGAEPKKKSSQLADSTQTTIQPNQTKSRPLSQLESTFPAQESLDQSNGQPSAVDTSTSITNGVDNEVIPIQSKSSVVSPSEVLNREDPVTRTRSTIQSRNLNLPPLASDTAKSNSPHQSKSNGKPAAGRLSKIFGQYESRLSKPTPTCSLPFSFQERLRPLFSLIGQGFQLLLLAFPSFDQQNQLTLFSSSLLVSA